MTLDNLIKELQDIRAKLPTDVELYYLNEGMNFPPVQYSDNYKIKVETDGIHYTNIKLTPK